MVPSATHSRVELLQILDVAIAFGFGGHVMTPFNAGIIIIVKDVGHVVSSIGYPKDERWEIMLQVLTVSLDPMFVARISALPELNDVCSCRSAFQQIGPRSYS
jgi:hypothetical protein